MSPFSVHYHTNQWFRVGSLSSIINPLYIITDCVTSFYFSPQVINSLVIDSIIVTIIIIIDIGG